MSSPLRRQFTDKFKVPNCSDPVFRKWCELCELVPGQRYDWNDARVARMQEIMAERFNDPTYDPEQDTADDYLNPFRR